MGGTAVQGAFISGGHLVLVWDVYLFHDGFFRCGVWEGLLGVVVFNVYVCVCLQGY